MGSITSRQKIIIRRLCKEKDFTTMTQIANELAVSSKTVARELSLIEKLLKKNNVKLQRKTGYGIKVIASDKVKKELLEKMNEESGIILFSQEDRKILSLVQLLKRREPIKLYVLSRSLNVTESTISNDLDKIDAYLQDYKLLLIRKPGLGIYIEGKEKDIRRASIDLIYRNIGFEYLLEIKNDHNLNNTKSTVDVIKNRVLNLISIDKFKSIDFMIKEIEKDINIKFVETSYIGIIVHILLVIQRVKLNEYVEVDKDVEEKIKQYNEYVIANKIKDKIEKHLNIQLPINEVVYLTIHLRGLKKYNQSTYNNDLTMENLKIIKLTKDIIKIAEGETGMFLDGDGELFIGLVHHLTSAINRMSMNLDIRNPIFKEIKEHYPYIFNITLKCAHLIEERFSIEVPESEIGYIAMHLGGAIVKINKDYEQMYQVVISCTLGIGSSGLLKSRVEKEFPNIKVSEIIPIENVRNDYLKDSKIDFVISTVKVANQYKPIICVNPLLLIEDKVRIEQLLESIKKENINKSVTRRSNKDTQEAVDTLRESIEGITQILKNFDIYQYDQPMTLENVIHNISKSLGKGEEAKKDIEESFIDREKLGSTVLGEKSAMLLHCRTRGVDEAYFQVVRLKNEFKVEGLKETVTKVNLILVMVVPEKCNKNHLDVLRYISQSIIEKERFIEDLRNKDFGELKEDLNGMLLYYYRKKV